ncbi:MAG: NADH-quinone oxidoreductase subunit L [Deltaproteobacteria bacterium]|nr:NADH-quinone oxidoreductase subunit L [Deltaproteobacteria bacterium]
MESLLWLIPAAPLVGFLLNGMLVGPWLQRTANGATAVKPAAHGHAPVDDGHGHGPAGPTWPLGVIAAIAVAGPLLGFVLSIVALLAVRDGHPPLATYWSWIHTGGLDVGFGLSVDALTAVMLSFVTGIGTLIHLYSYGYMNHDAGFYRFMAYLNLFMFSMLCLVLGSNLLVMFLGWEGVGLCSYLLIGFWYDDLANVDAGRKAFVVNRIGDFAFLLGLFTLYLLAGSLDFATLESAIGPANPAAILTSGPFTGWTLGGVLTLAATSLFVGATGKSAQIPLFVWLPDAMAGPTPVSALIHAATMVTAGVYMIARLDFLYALTPSVTLAIGVVAAFTALLSGLIAFAQYDIKKILAYSTVSQLGFMFAGMATTFWTAGLFHVITHAFFKALLFLGAGAVIHALSNEQDIRKMGGLWRDMKVESILFLVGAAALAGLPPFAGFWSKDEILGNTLVLAQMQGGLWWLVFGILMLTAALTAFYTTRLVMIAFFGAPADPHRHPHPTHWTILVPLAILALLSAFGGLALGPTEALAHFTAPVWTVPAWHATIDPHLEHSAHLTAKAMSTFAAVGGVALAAFLYGWRRSSISSFVHGPGRVPFWLASNKFLVDELYDRTIVQPTKWLAGALFTGVDRAVIDSLLVSGSGRLTLGVGSALRRAHSGALNAATASMVLGAVVIAGYLAWLVSNG